MSEVIMKKKKKRHHSCSSNDFEAPMKRIKVEIDDTADESIALPVPSVGLNCDASIMEHRRKKKHKHQNAAGVDADIMRQGNVELSRTSISSQRDMSTVSVEHEPGLERNSSHRSSKHIEQQDSSQQQQCPGSSIQTIDRLHCPELRYGILVLYGITSTIICAHQHDIMPVVAYTDLKYFFASCNSTVEIDAAETVFFLTEKSHYYHRLK